MLKKIIKNKVVYIGILLLLSVLFLFLSTRYSLPKIIEITPPNNSTSFSPTQEINVTFEKPINYLDFKIEATPENIFSLSGPQPNTLKVSHAQTLLPNTKYSLVISDSKKFAYTYVFSTYSSQTDYRFLEEVRGELERDYPLASFTPYSTPQYRVVYSAPMVLEITLKNSNLKSTEVIDQVKSWVKSLGGNVESHKYIISNKPLPSSTPTGAPENRNTGTPTPSPTPFNWDTLQDDGT